MCGYAVFFFFEYKECRFSVLFSIRFYIAFSMIYLYICHADVTASAKNFELAQFFLICYHLGFFVIDNYYDEVTNGEDLFNPSAYLNRTPEEEEERLKKRNQEEEDEREKFAQRKIDKLQKEADEYLKNLRERLAKADEEYKKMNSSITNVEELKQSDIKSIFKKDVK
jgi:flagellar biosynthesis GTPase FlhF